jgi:magnesium-transporting ATPase (P-type)
VFPAELQARAWTLSLIAPLELARAVTETKMSVTQKDTTAPAYAVPVDAILSALAVDDAWGLTHDEVAERRMRYGYNELAEAPGIPLWRKFLGQFNALVIWILLIAALVSGFVGEWADALAILAIVLVNAIIGFLQEERAERSLTALRKLSAPTPTTSFAGGRSKRSTSSAGQLPRADGPVVWL